MPKEKKKVVDHEERLNVQAGGFLSDLWALLIWFVGIFVSLAVGFGMIDKVLRIWYIPTIVTEVVGWLVVVLTLVGLILKIVDKLSGR